MTLNFSNSIKTKIAAIFTIKLLTDELKTVLLTVKDSRGSNGVVASKWENQFFEKVAANKHFSFGIFAYREEDAGMEDNAIACTVLRW